MKPGRRELDALIYEKVMGFSVHFDKDIPPYSTNISWAMDVVRKINKSFDTHHTLFSGENYYSDFENRTYRGEPDTFGSGWVEDPAYAICLSALKVVGYETK